MNRFTRYIAAGTLAVGMALASAAHAELRQITIGTNPAGSVYFLLGGGFAKLFQKELGIRSVASPHAGSSVYLPLLNQGEITLGLNSSLDAAMAYAAEPPFDERLTNVRQLARIWIIPYGFTVRANSGIEAMEQLRGKRVIVDIKSVVSLGDLNRTLLATAGLEPGMVQSMDTGGLVQGINAVVEGRADATAVAAGMPAMREADAGVPGGMRMVALGDKASDRFMEAHTPGSRVLEAKPADRLVGIPEPMRIAAFDSFLNAGVHVSEEDAYLLTRTIHENWKQLRKDYPPFRIVGEDELVPPTNVMPYHPGAVKYWKDAGLWTEANQKQQDKLLARLPK